MGFSQALSGLNAAATNLDVIGNNIANSATYGFKAGSVAFADMFAGSQVGLGVSVAGINQNFNGGAITRTNGSLDVAIDGQGFFRMQDADGGIFYGRNGQFKRDADGFIINQQGLNLTGYPAAGNPPTIQQGANPVPLRILEDMMAARATTAASMVLNLDSGHDVPEITPFDPNSPESFNYSTAVTSYDSLGNAHNIKVYFVKTADNEWEVYSQDTSVDDADYGQRGTLSFDANGVLTTTGALTIPMSAKNGAPAQNFSLDFTGSKQQSVENDSVSNITQDGYAAGEFLNFRIEKDGTVVGMYSNQKSQLLGQIVLTNFSNPGGLAPQGNNVWQETGASGQPRVGLAGSGGLVGGALESSNVDMGAELVNMIIAQRNYQSNAQTIKTQDSLLQTLVTLR